MTGTALMPIQRKPELGCADERMRSQTTTRFATRSSSIAGGRAPTPASSGSMFCHRRSESAPGSVTSTTPGTEKTSLSERDGISLHSAIRRVGASGSMPSAGTFGANTCSFTVAATPKARPSGRTAELSASDGTTPRVRMRPAMALRVASTAASVVARSASQKP